MRARPSPPYGSPRSPQHRSPSPSRPARSRNSSSSRARARADAGVVRRDRAASERGVRAHARVVKLPARRVAPLLGILHLRPTALLALVGDSLTRAADATISISRPSDCLPLLYIKNRRSITVTVINSEVASSKPIVYDGQRLQQPSTATTYCQLLCVKAS